MDLSITEKRLFLAIKAMHDTTEAALLMSKFEAEKRKRDLGVTDATEYSRALFALRNQAGSAPSPIFDAEILIVLNWAIDISWILSEKEGFSENEKKDFASCHKYFKSVRDFTY